MQLNTNENGVTVHIELLPGDPMTLRQRVANALWRLLATIRYRLVRALVGKRVCVMNATFHLAKPFSADGADAFVSGNTFVEA